MINGVLNMKESVRKEHREIAHGKIEEETDFFLDREAPNRMEQRKRLKKNS